MLFSSLVLDNSSRKLWYVWNRLSFELAGKKLNSGRVRIPGFTVLKSPSSIFVRLIALSLGLQWIEIWAFKISSSFSAISGLPFKPWHTLANWRMYLSASLKRLWFFAIKSTFNLSWKSWSSDSLTALYNWPSVAFKGNNAYNRSCFSTVANSRLSKHISKLIKRFNNTKLYSTYSFSIDKDFLNRELSVFGFWTIKVLA